MQEQNTSQSKSGYHRIDDLMRCPRLFAYRGIMRLVPLVKPSALAAGTASHEPLACHYRGESWEKAFENPDPSWASKIPKARNIMKAYVQHYTKEPFKVLAVEQEFEILLKTPKNKELLFTRRLDLVVKMRDKDGYEKAFILDHKTAADPKTRVKSVKFDGTLISQDWLGRKGIIERDLHVPYGGFILNLIGKKKPYKFDRVRWNFHERLIDEMERDLVFWLNFADNMLTGSMNPWHAPKSLHCQGQYGFCEYWDLCVSGPSALPLFKRGE